jgi:hypothetical protein
MVLALAIGRPRARPQDHLRQLRVTGDAIDLPSGEVRGLGADVDRPQISPIHGQPAIDQPVIVSGGEGCRRLGIGQIGDPELGWLTDQDGVVDPVTLDVICEREMWIGAGAAAVRRRRIAARGRDRVRVAVMRVDDAPAPQVRLPRLVEIGGQLVDVPQARMDVAVDQVHTKAPSPRAGHHRILAHCLELQ